MLVTLLCLAASCGHLNTGWPASSGERFHLVGPITRDVVPYIVEFLATAKHPEILIDSPGGSMDASIAIGDAVRTRGNVKCYARDLAASGAAYVFQTCKTRPMSRKARIVFHEPRVMMPTFMERVELGHLLFSLVQGAAQWNELCRFRLKLTADEYEAKVRGRDWILDADEALSVGAADFAVQ